MFDKAKQVARLLTASVPAILAAGVLFAPAANASPTIAVKEVAAARTVQTEHNTGCVVVVSTCTSDGIPAPQGRVEYLVSGFACDYRIRNIDTLVVVRQGRAFPTAVGSVLVPPGRYQLELFDCLPGHWGSLSS